MNVESLSPAASQREIDSLRALNARLSSDLSSLRRTCASAEELAITNGARADTASGIVMRLQAENKNIADDARRARDEESERHRESTDGISASLARVDARIALVSAESSRANAESLVLRDEIGRLRAEITRLEAVADAACKTMELEGLNAAALTAEAGARVAAAETDARLARAGETAARNDAASVAPAIVELSASFQKTLIAHKAHADDINSKLSRCVADSDARLIKSMSEHTETLRHLAEATAQNQTLSLTCTALQVERDSKTTTAIFGVASEIG